MPFNAISVVGLGYIGLPTAAMFASRRKNVVGVDINQNTVDIINAGNTHIVEPELNILVRAAVSQGYLRAVTQPETADVFIIAVPTPFLPVTKEGEIPQPDLRFVESASKAIASVLKKGDLVILESTSPVGATEQMAEWLADRRPDLTFPQTHGVESDIRIAHCPERVLPGHVVRELVENDRIIGGMTERCSEAAIQLYKIFVEGECMVTNARTAEMAKLTENASRDVSIAFANELSIICDKLEINVWELIELANRHPRVNILQPGPGVGGHCIAVDPWFIVSSAPSEAQLIRTGRSVNDYKPKWVIEKVKIAIADFLQSNPKKRVGDVVIACYGLSFKPDIDDLRESPSMLIAQNIAEFHEGKILGIEPNIKELPTCLNIELVSLDDAEARADIAVLLVDHKEFKISGAPNIKIIIDTKGVWL
ncbi:UDP-N-acetyl-D-mannosamine dehydrogenase [Gammaproteobacteria bacterium]|nr:UDP-N-acetyl-D-mannosamine dehydrogenase [Gammaproteobacteria bacterium]MDC0090016.1 UDP-N-acetyl-D-mannosamine dehydrogenase [Gammaproteobacteria bacterium]